MKTLIALLACAALPVLAWAGPSEKFASGYALANEKGCFECHALGHTEVVVLSRCRPALSLRSRRA